MKHISMAAVLSLLEWQRIEFQSNFDVPNHALHEIVVEAPEKERLRVGLELIDSEDPARRILGIRLIREVHEEKIEIAAIERLADLLRAETDENVIYWIVGAFGFLESAKVTDKLVALAGHIEPGIRYHVATALMNSGSEDVPAEIWDALSKLCHDGNAEVRFSAVFEVGSWYEASSDDRAKRELALALNDDDPFVARAAKDALECK